MDIAFLCGLFPPDLESQIILNSKGRIDFAANNLQWAFVKGLDHHNNKPIKLFNLLFVGSYPFGYKSAKINSFHFSHSEGAADINIGFSNLFAFKFFSRLFAAFLSLLKWSKNDEGDKKILLIYAIHTPFLLPAILIKLLNPKVKLCLIVPDLPQYMSDSRNFFYRFLKNIDSILIKFSLNRIDSFVLLSEFMSNEINIDKRPKVIIEGIYDDSIICNDFTNVKDENKIIMYSGNLNVSQGILELLKAFAQINDKNYNLWFTGYGDGLQHIKSAAKFDTRIMYFENLTKIELLEKQSKVTVLINPLKITHPKVKFFFPSKTMEYLASGKPTLMYKLPSIPIDYYDYLFFIEGESINHMKEKMIEICEKSQFDLDNLGFKSKKFINREKTPIPQCEKLYNLLNLL